MPRAKDANAKIKLLAAAEAVFVERGLDHAKVEDITKRAGLSKGAFYLHFESKEHAFRQLAESTIARMAVCIDTGYRIESLELHGGLAQYVEIILGRDVELFEFLWHARGMIRLLLEGGKSADFGHLIDEFAELARGNVAQILRRGIDAGIYRKDLDVELASLFLAGAYDRLARHVVRQDKKPDIAGMLRRVQTLIVFGFFRDGARAELAKAFSR